MNVHNINLRHPSVKYVTLCRDYDVLGTTRHLLAHTLREAAMKLGWNTTRMRGGVYVFRVNTRCHNIPLVSLIKMLKF